MASSQNLKLVVKNKVKSKPKPNLKLCPDIDSNKWVVVQLTSLGEREKNLAQFERSARKILKRNDIQVFVPAITQKVRDESLTTWYADGYVFIKFIDGIRYLSLQETAYFNMVLSKLSIVNGSKKLIYSLLTDKDLDPIRTGMKLMKVGKFNVNDQVKIIKGNYKNLLGKITCIYDGDENVQVYVDLRSKKLFIDFPSSYLSLIEII